MHRLESLCYQGFCRRANAAVGNPPTRLRAGRERSGSEAVAWANFGTNYFFNEICAILLSRDDPANRKETFPETPPIMAG